MRGLLQSFNVILWAWRGVAPMLLRPRIWGPFLLVGVVQAAFLLLFLSFHHPVLLPVALPLIKLLGGGEGATHYPVLYLALPILHLRTKVAITILLASIATGAATILFARAYGLGEREGAWSRAFRRAPALIIVSILVVAAWFGISMLGTLVPQEMLNRSSAVRWATRGSVLLLSLLVQCFMVYTTAWIVIAGHKLWPAIRDSVRVSVRTFLPTLIALAVPALLVYPFSYAAGRADFIALRFRPELVGWLLGATVAFEVLIAFLIVGTITRLFVWRMEGSR